MIWSLVTYFWKQDGGYMTQKTRTYGNMYHLLMKACVENKAKFQVDFFFLSTWNCVHSSLSGLQRACYTHLMCFPGQNSAKSVCQADLQSLRWCPGGREQNKLTPLPSSSPLLIPTQIIVIFSCYFCLELNCQKAFKNNISVTGRDGFHLFPLQNNFRKCLRCLKQQTGFPLRSQRVGQSHRGQKLKQMGRKSSDET